jgi:hypothetical protein
MVLTALLLLGAWFLGVLGVYDGGRLIHVLLLASLTLLLLAVRQDRDAAAGTRRSRG